MLHNTSIEINKSDNYGVNAFWIASFYGHVEVSTIIDKQTLHR